MIRIEYQTEEDLREALKVLSDFGSPKIGKKLEFDSSEEYYLILDYDKSYERLKEIKEIIDKDFDMDKNPAEYLLRALDSTKKLFETKKSQEIVDKNFTGPIHGNFEEKLLDVLETIEDLDNIEGLKENIKNLKELKSEIKEFKDTLENPEQKEDEKEEDHKQEPLKVNPIFEKIPEMKWNKNFLTEPILESLFRHAAEDDPLTSFKEEVYLNVDVIRDLFKEEELRAKISSDVFVSYIIEMDINCILREKAFVEALECTYFLNQDIYSKIKISTLIVHYILETLEKQGKAKYEEFVEEVVEKVNKQIINLGELDLSLELDPEAVELIIKELEKNEFIRKKGKRNMIKYVGP